MFKKLFSSEENKVILQGFITDFFKFTPDLDDIHVEHPYTISSFRQAYKTEMTEGPSKTESDIKLRQTLRDLTVSCKTADVISELQINRVRHFTQRCLYYAFSKFVSNFGVDDQASKESTRPNYYASLKPVYSLNILDYLCFKDDSDALRFFQLWDTQHHSPLPGEPFYLGFFELRKPQISGTHIQAWQDFFTRGEVPDGAPSYLHLAVDRINNLNLSEEERDMIDQMEKAQATYNAVLDYSHHAGLEEGHALGVEEGRALGIEEGHAQGIEEGRSLGVQEGRALGIEEGHSQGLQEGFTQGISEGETKALKQVVRRMSSSGQSNEARAKLTGLSIESVTKLL
jgi:hypothetical protein